MVKKLQKMAQKKASNPAGLLDNVSVIKSFTPDRSAEFAASLEALDSALVRGIYDYAFGFRNGMAGAEHRAIAAGTSLRGLCRMTFTYRGSYFFKMRGGMGDTVFTPYYKVLKARGRGRRVA